MEGFSFTKRSHPESQHLQHLIYLILISTPSHRALIKACLAQAKIIPQEAWDTSLTGGGSVSAGETFPDWLTLI